MPPAPMPPPYGSPEGPARDARPRESKLEAAAPAEQVPELTEPAAPSLQPVAQTEAEPAAAPETSEAVPLSPHEPPPAPAFDAPDWEPEPPHGPEAEVEARHDMAADAVIAPSEPLEPPPEPPEPPVERARPTPFDAIWPPAPRYAEAAAVVAAPQHDGEVVSAAAPATPAVESEVESEVSRQPEGAAAEPATADAAAGDETADAPYAVSILKSGVVDGMAYTLYSDGSIEAELASGTIRFESIAALRMHLEKTG